MLLENGAKVGAALQVACFGGHRDVVEYLLEHGASINTDVSGFRTPIEAAAAGNHLDLLSLLVQKSEGLDYPSQALNAALERAAESGDEHLARVLLDRGADPQDGIGWGLSDLCNVLSGTEDKENDRILYQCALERSARNGHESVFRLLLSRVIRSTYCPEVQAALESAAEFGHISIVQMLLGESISLRDQGKALSAATKGGHDKIVRILVERGARISPEAITSACMEGNIELLNLLLRETKSHLRAEMTGSALLGAAIKGNCDMVTTLLQYSADVNALADYPDFGPYMYEGPLEMGSTSEVNQEELDSESADNNYTSDSDASSEVPNFEEPEREEPNDEDLIGDIVNPEADRESVGTGAVEDSDSESSDISSFGSRNRELERDSQLGITALHGAIFAGHESVTRILLEYNASLAVKGLRMPSVLQVASLFGRVEIVKTLVNMRADVNEISGRYGTALQGAAFAGSMEIVRVLLDNGADVNQESGRFGTALQAAASQRHEAVVQQLLDAGADVQREGGPPGLDPRERESRTRIWLSAIHTLFERPPSRWQNGLFGTSLQAAANSGSVEIVRMLLARDADIGVTDEYGQTPLHHAACQGHDSVVALLLQRGANPNIEDNMGRSSIIMAASNGWKSVLARLSGAGASPISTKKYCNSALHHAASNGHVTVLEQLLAKGYDVNQTNQQGETSLMVAAEMGRTSAVRFLLDKGSNLNHRDNQGDTAINRAVRRGRSAVVRLLLARGADPNKRENDGLCLLHVSTSDPYEEKYPRPGGNELQVLYTLANHPGIQRELRDGAGATTLHRAAGMWNPWMMAILVDSGADIEAQDAVGLTPLHYCVNSSRITPSTPIAALQYLVSKGANINAESNNGENARVLARRCLRDNYAYEELDKYLASLGLPLPPDEIDILEDEGALASFGNMELPDGIPTVPPYQWVSNH